MTPRRRIVIMAFVASVIILLCAGASIVGGSPVALSKRASEPDPKFAVSVELNGVTFVNKVCHHADLRLI